MPRPANRLRALAAALLLAAGLGGCVTDGDAVASVDAAALPAGDSALRDYAADWGKRHDAQPDDVVATLNYARALRALTQYSQAVAVLESAAARRPDDRALLGAFGKALADAGRPREALEVLARAHTPERPDWSVLSAQGTAADALDDHAKAVEYYEAALKIRPGEPAVLSNLGLSYALARDLPRAEEALRAAAADPRADARVRQNYALVLSLGGKFKLAEDVAAVDLPRADAAASVDAIRRMIAGNPRWRGMEPGRTPPGPGPGPGRPPALDRAASRG